MKCLLPVLICVAILTPVFGVQRTYIGSTSGTNPWENDNNWNPLGVPGFADDIIIPYHAAEFTVTINSQAVCNSLFLGGPARTESTFQNPWPASQSQTLYIESGMLSIYGNASIYQSGVLTVRGSEIEGLGIGTTILIQGSIVFSNSGTHTLTTLVLEIATGGYMTVLDEPNGVILGGAASILIDEGGNLTLATTYGIGNTDSTEVSVVNYGDFVCAPGSGDGFSTQLSAAFQNFGNVYIQGGQMSFNVNSSWHGTLNVSSASVNVTAGTHVFFSDSAIQGDGAFQVQNEAVVTLQGEVQISDFVLAAGSAAVIIDNPLLTSFNTFVMLGGDLIGSQTSMAQFTWAGGQIQLASLTVGQLQIVGAVTASVSSTPFTVTGLATFADTTHLLLFNTTFLLQGTMIFDKPIFFICNKTDLGSSLQVAGLLQLTYTSVTTLTCALSIQAGGTINTVFGSLDIQTEVTSYGTLNISTGSNVIIETTSTFFVGSSVIGNGSLNCQSCNAYIYGTFDIGTLLFPAGNITVQADGVLPYTVNVQFYNQSGSSALTLINNSPQSFNFQVENMLFSGGSISSNQNKNLYLQTNVFISNSSSFYGPQPYVFTNVALVNNGTTTFYSNSVIKFWENSIIYNTPSGAINILDGFTTSQNDESGYLSDIYNYGFIQAVLGADAQLVLNFHNLGSGVLIINGQMSVNTGFFTQEDDATTIILETGSLTLTNAGLFLGGALNGTGKINGAVTVDGATLYINDDSGLTINDGTFLLRGSGVVEVDVSSNGVLQLTSLCQISGGDLVLFSSSGVAPNTKQFIQSPSVVGSGFASISSAALNSSFGFSVTNTSGSVSSMVAPNPVVQTITPTFGSAGTVVTLSGYNFMIEENYWNISVLCDGIVIPSQLATRNTISTVIPVGTGNISLVVFASGRSSSAVPWTFSSPTISTVVPSGGSTLGGEYITIQGANFGAQAYDVDVTFGDYGECNITQISNAEIVCISPPGLGANVSVVVQASQQSSSQFLYSYAAPTLLSVYPSAIVIGDGTPPVITIVGQNLASTMSAQQGNLSVKIGNYTCSHVQLVSLTVVTCTVPALKTNGSYPVTVEVQAQQSKEVLAFTAFDLTPPPPPSQPTKPSSGLWPLPWWLYLTAAGTCVLLLILGIGIGCFAKAKRIANGYEAVPTLKIN